MENPNKLENQSEDSLASHRNRKMANQEANVESARLLIIFPKEIWVLIFENIFQSVDLFHLTKSSELFGMLLRKQRTTTLFPEVIKILAENLATPSTFAIGAHGRIPRYLLNCRLVCRTWQIGVDTALQSSNMHSKLLDVACHQGLSILSSSSDAHFSSPEQAGVFLQKFDGEYATKYRNPFIDRSLHIMFPSIHQPTVTDLESFTQKLMQILTIYGHNIWNFGFYLVLFGQPFDSSNVWFYERLRDFLQLMPNLKAFRLTCIGGHPDDKWKALELNLTSCAFPELKDLTHLQLEDVPTPLFDALLRRYSHVNMLSPYSSMGTSKMLIYTHVLPNLTQIALSSNDIYPLIRWDSSIAVWPLKTLIIRLNLFELSLDWQSLFQVVENRWASTLTELKLDFFHVHIRNNHAAQVLPTLNLPNLKVFAFSTYVLVPLDFILPMRNSLQRLVIQYCYPVPERAELVHRVETDNEIQFFRFCRNLESSNIWSLFPKLNTAECYDGLTRKQFCRRPLSIV